MKKEAMRLAVAEACGWTRCDPSKFESDDLWHMKGLGFALTKHLPDYPSDLNAMNEAILWACKNVTKFGPNFNHEVDLISTRERLHVWELEAHHFCEAFCKTMFLWVEEKDL